MVNTYKTIDEIPVFLKAHELVLEIYALTSKFPSSENFGLTSQLRRSAASIPANITEGYYRHSTKELIQFLYNARGSLGETLYHIKLAKDLKYTSFENYENLTISYNDVAKQLNGWINSLRSKING
jgi:four helix bundle protein